MQFETKIINGKPNIFFKQEPTIKVFNPLKKVNIKDKQAKKDLLRSIDISGEIDMVRPSPHSSDAMSIQKNNTINNKKQNGFQTTKESNSVSKQIPAKQNSIHSLNDFNHQNHNNNNNNEDEIQVYIPKRQENFNYMDDNNNRFLTSNKSKDDSNLQELLSNYSSIQNGFSNTKIEPSFFKSTLTLAEKKRLQWQQEKEAQSMISAQNNSMINLTKETNYNNKRIDSNQDRFETNSNNLYKTTSLVENLNTINELNNNNNNNNNRLSLMDKKKQKWNEEIKEANVPWIATNKSSMHVENFETNPKSKKYQESLDEYQKISKTLEAIVAAENKIKQEQQSISSSSSSSSSSNNRMKQEFDLEQNNFSPSSTNVIINNKENNKDQSKVPAAMRTSLMFGDVRYDDDIKKTKELERRKWLQELESQKNEKLLLAQKKLLLENHSSFEKINDNLTPHEPKHTFGISEPSNGEDKSFARTRLLLDPAEIDALEARKQKSLQHMREIEQQILEKKKLTEVQNLNNLKTEREGNQFLIRHQEKLPTKLSNESINNIINNNNNNNHNNQNKKQPDSIASILQSDLKEENQISNRNPNSNNAASEMRAKEIFKTMQLAELAAAEEKHNRLLKRLQRGGHDTRNLENKFSEYKAKILASTSDNPSLLSSHQNEITDYKNNQNKFNSNLKSNGMDTNRTNFSDHENLKQNLYSINNNKNTNNDSSSISNEKMKQIFNILREDTNGIPAEINQEHLKALLKNVIQNNEPTSPETNNSKVNNSNNNNKNNKKPTQNKSAETNKSKASKENNNKPPIKNSTNQKPPIWNYKNLEGRNFKKNSEKDPFYTERKAFNEERKRLEQKQEKNNQKFKDYIHQHQDQLDHQDNYSNENYDNQSNDFNQHQNVTTTNRSTTNRNSLSTLTNDNYLNNNESNNTKKNESVLSLINKKNFATNTIYEDEEDRYSYKQTPKNSVPNGKLLTNRSNSSRDDSDFNKNGFVPFMRTNEFLDPVHAKSPIPPSRESSAIKRDREKARQAYFQNMKPANHGHNLDSNYDYKKKDPLLNNELVTNNPTQRQTEILSQLATLKQSLMKKQREVASSIQLENDMNNFDLND